MPSTSVFGAQWGDEGKGKVIDLLARDVDLVVRYQGGANAGHTVVVEGQKFVLHHVPSGILHSGTINVIGAGVAVDPATLRDELAGLAERGRHVDGRNLRVCATAHVIFEHHKLLDRLSERWRGAGRIGTTGRGIGPCYADKAARTGLRVADLLEPDTLRPRLKAALAEKNALLERVHGEPTLDLAETTRRYLELGEFLRPFVGDTGAEVRAAFERGKRILFEGAQGVMLDIDAGTYPFVTSSNTGVAAIGPGAGFPARYVQRVIGIAKAYCTRVGEGPFPSELHGPDAERLRKLGNEYGATTGRPRRCGWLDAVALRYALEINGADGWVVTNLDVLSDYDEIEVATTYHRGDERWDTYPAHLASLEDVRVTTDVLPGWKSDITGIRKYDELPAKAQAYVEWLERTIGVPIVMISVGPDREQIIRRGALEPQAVTA